MSTTHPESKHGFSVFNAALSAFPTTPEGLALLCNALIERWKVVNPSATHGFELFDHIRSGNADVGIFISNLSNDTARVSIESPGYQITLAYSLYSARMAVRQFVKQLTLHLLVQYADALHIEDGEHRYKKPFSLSLARTQDGAVFLAPSFTQGRITLSCSRIMTKITSSETADVLERLLALAELRGHPNSLSTYSDTPL